MEDQEEVYNDVFADEAVSLVEFNPKKNCKCSALNNFPTLKIASLQFSLTFSR